MLQKYNSYVYQFYIPSSLLHSYSHSLIDPPPYDVACLDQGADVQILLSARASWRRTFC
jgi:hypothetical protein